MFRRIGFCLLAVVALASSCGSGDRSLIVDQAIENFADGSLLLRPCVESVADEFSPADADRIMTAIEQDTDLPVESFSPQAQAIMGRLWWDCIDLEAYRERTIEVAVERDPNVDAECLRYELPLDAVGEDMGAAIMTAARFCGGT